MILLLDEAVMGLNIFEIIVAAIIAFIVTCIYDAKLKRDEYYTMSLYDSSKPYICIIVFDMVDGGRDTVYGYTNMTEENLGLRGEIFRTSYVLKLMPFIRINGMELIVLDKNHKVVKSIDMNNVEDMSVVFRRNSNQEFDNIL